MWKERGRQTLYNCCETTSAESPLGASAQPAADYPVSPVNPQEQNRAQLSPAQVPDPEFQALS